jgi:hypothetical protein
LLKNVKTKIWVIIILLAVLCECEALSLIQRKKHKLRVFRKEVLETMFRYKRSRINIIRANKSRGMRWEGHVVYTGRKFMPNVGRNSWRKRYLRKSECMCEYNIKMDIKGLRIMIGLSSSDFGSGAGPWACCESWRSIKVETFWLTERPAPLKEVLVHGIR